MAATTSRPFVDTNPDAGADQRYKALGGTGAPGLIAFASPDGIHWRELQKEPVITKGAFDSQNNAFWSESEGRYVCYFRVFREGKRWIARTTSADFIHWTDPVDLELDGKPRQHLYTNQIVPYVRAPHIYLGLPTRFIAGPPRGDRGGSPPDRHATQWNYANDCTDICWLPHGAAPISGAPSWKRISGRASTWRTGRRGPTMRLAGSSKPATGSCRST